jgi:hypothetical protein
MTLTINDTTMTSDQTGHTARLASGSRHLRVLDRNSAITAMVLADHAREPDLNERHRLWPFIESWAAELGLTGSDAVDQVSRPGAPGQPRDREGERPDLEAGQ